MFYVWTQDGITYGYNDKTHVLYEKEDGGLVMTNHNPKLVNVYLKSNCLCHYGFVRISAGVFSIASEYAVHVTREDIPHDLAAELMQLFTKMNQSKAPLEFIK